MLVRTIYLDDVKPFSLNNAYANAGKRRVMSKPYDKWTKDVIEKLVSQNRNMMPVVKGYFGLSIQFDRRLSKADIDNCIKPLVDCMVKANIIPDDRKLEKVCIQKTTDAGIYIEIYDMNESANKQIREV